MFEKEAIEYATRDVFFDGVPKPVINHQRKEDWQKGAVFGYNKANEWHYVKDELPEKEKFILIYTDLKNVYIARLVEDDYFITNKGGFVQTSSVIAWKEIILPKEEE